MHLLNAFSTWAFPFSNGVHSYLRFPASVYKPVAEHFRWSKIQDPDGMNAKLWASDFPFLRGAYSYCCDVPIKEWV